MDKNTNPSPATNDVHFRVFDIEIAKSVEEVGGWDAARKGLAGLSCAALYDSETNQTKLYGPQDVERLGEALEGPFVIVSYNGIGFDVPAVEGMLKRKLDIRCHLDLLDLLVQTTGARKGLTLENVARHTLGRGKSGSGKFAPDMYKTACRGGEQGVQEAVNLLAYCSLDVTLTRDLLVFLQANGFVIGPNGPIHPTLPPYFAQLARV